MGKSGSWTDTIVALATAPGVGALAVIRLSGIRSFEIVSSFFKSKNLLNQQSHTLHVGMFQYNGRHIDEVVVSLYKTPRSYTGEDVVEISCHGSPFVQQAILNACIASGARLAKPGEFTQRAFLNAKMDLAQAEAVADLIASNTRAAQKTALQQMRGGFSRSLKDLREDLIKFSALIELELDFSQEDVIFADRKELNRILGDAIYQTETLIHSFQAGNVIRNGVSVAIVGRPNAGKSTLLNILLKEERAIVSSIPGTTRDTIEEIVNIDGILFRLIDTAGIREQSNDAIENEGIERSRSKMKSSDLVIYLFDATSLAQRELEEVQQTLKSQSGRFLLVANKIDLLENISLTGTTNEEVINISAQTGLHVEALKKKMVEAVWNDAISGESLVITNARHYEALKRIAESLREVRKGLDDQIPGDLLALDIRRSLHFLGEITGEVTTEDQLDFIFSKFCIGK